MSKVVVSFILFISLMSNADINKSIKNASKTFNVPEKLLYEIAFVESSMRENPPIRWNKNGTYDVGLFQINSVHWFDMCKEFNVMELNGNSLCAAKLLSIHMKYKHIDPYWVARYHSKNYNKKLIYWNKLVLARKYLKNKIYKIFKEEYDKT